MSTDLDLDSTRRRHDEDHEHDGGCDTLDLLAEVERLRDLGQADANALGDDVLDQRRRAEKAEAERDRLQAAVDAVEGVIRGVSLVASSYIRDALDEHLGSPRYEGSPGQAADRAALDEHLGSQ